MVFAASAAVVLTAAAVYLVWSRQVRLWVALVCAAAGFCLAGTGIAPAVRATLTALAAIKF